MSIHRLTDKPFMTVADVSLLMDVSEPTIRKWIKQGNLKAFVLKDTIRIKQTDFDNFINQNMR